MDKKNSRRQCNTIFQSLELCLAKSIPSILKRLFPPADAPANEILVAQEQRKSRIREVAARLAVTRRILVENRRRLSGQSTPRFERATSPDVWIPEDIEEAQEIERRARRAQKALIAAAKELPRPERECDVAFRFSESCLAESIQSTLEWLSPPLNAAADGMMAAEERWWGPEVTALLTEEKRLLTEIGRHRHLLCKESIAILDWRNGPDVYIPTTLEEA